MFSCRLALSTNRLSFSFSLSTPWTPRLRWRRLLHNQIRVATRATANAPPIAMPTTTPVLMPLLGCFMGVVMDVGVGDGVSKEDEVESSVVSVVDDAVGSVVVVGSPRVTVVCLVTVTVESLGIVLVTPESDTLEELLGAGEVSDEDGGDALGGFLDVDDDVSVLVASSLVVVAGGWDAVGSINMIDEVEVAEADFVLELLLLVEDDSAFEDELEESSLSWGLSGQLPRVQASMEQQPAKPLEQRYHCVFVGQAVR